MNRKFKQVLMNGAVLAALVYRWLTGTPPMVLLIAGIIMFGLVNGLLWLTQRNFNQPRRFH
jgi:hypothetical protein